MNQPKVDKPAFDEGRIVIVAVSVLVGITILLGVSLMLLLLTGK